MKLFDFFSRKLVSEKSTKQKDTVEPDPAPEIEPVCPSCGVALERMPKARSKCKSCREWIHLKKPFKGKNQILMTAAMAEEQNQLLEEQSRQDEKERKKQALKDRNKATAIAKKGMKAFMAGNYAAAKELFYDAQMLVKPGDEPELYKNYFLHRNLAEWSDENIHPDIYGIRIYKSEHHPGEVCPHYDGALLPIKTAIKQRALPCASQPCTCWWEYVFNNEVE